MEFKNTISSTIKNKIKTFKEGYVFTYRDFENFSRNKEAIIKCLSRMTDDGKLHKFSKGKYYKPIIGNPKVFGPDLHEIIKDLLEKNGKLIGYITGLSLYDNPIIKSTKNHVIQIGRNTFKPKLYRSIYTIQFVFQKNEITTDNIEILQVLDCLKMISKLSDSDRDKFLKVIGKTIRKFNKNQKDILVQCSLKYNSGTRALLGVVFDIEKFKKGIDILMESLNPVSKYNLEINKLDRVLKDKWNIR